jgi:branched-chain amino acid transport system ATP-binding protein
MLTIARALMSKPGILLLDEPSLGLAPLICQQVFKLIQDLKDEGMTILLVEQNVREAVQLADYIYVLNTGTVAKEGDHNLFGKEHNLMAELTGIH